MKKIEAIIRPEKFEEVRDALETVGYPGITVTEVEGHGKQKGITRQWRGKEYKVSLLPKLKLEIVVPSKEADKIVKAVLSAAKTGKVGDGKVFVYTIDEAYKVSSGEEGDKTVS
jgi:nitrogen regulatory protein P-II 1